MNRLFGRRNAKQPEVALRDAIINVWSPSIGPETTPAEYICRPKAQYLRLTTSLKD